LGTKSTNQNSIQEETKSRFKAGNACYYSVQNLLFSSSLSKNIKTKVCRTIILRVVLYGYVTCSLTLKVKRRLSVFENRTLRRIFGPKKDEVTRKWRKLNDDELNYQYSSLDIIRVMKSRRMRWAGHVAYTVERRS